MNPLFLSFIKEHHPDGQDVNALLENAKEWEWLYDRLVYYQIEAKLQRDAYTKFHQLAANTIVALNDEIAKLKAMINEIK